MIRKFNSQMIYCECENDEVLFKAIGKTRKEIKHKSNKFEVCKFLKKDKNSIGLIDEDEGKTQDKYTESLVIEPKNNDIIIKKDNLNNNKVIILCPDLEKWIEKAIQESGIDKSKYYLPEDLHDIGTDDKKLKRLKEMLVDMHSHSQMLRTLINCL